MVIPVAHYEGDLLAPLLHVMRRPAFAERVQALGGYAVEGMGEVIETI
ncbi:MAG: hypothetical protein R2911_30610 [Caldilineaceae bacterium]